MDGWMDGKGACDVYGWTAGWLLGFLFRRSLLFFSQKAKSSTKNVWEGYRLHVMNENEEKDKTKWLRFFL